MEKFKEKRECWLMQEFQKALEKETSQDIIIECGDDGSSDGRLIIDNKKIPVQIVTAEKVLYEKSAQSRKNNEPIAYDVKPIEWIKGALGRKVNKKYQEENFLTLLIEYSGLNTININWLRNELAKDDIIKFAKHFKDVYIIAPSDSEFIKRFIPLREPVIIKINKI